MSYIQLDGISLAFGGRSILTDVHVTISPKSRIALTGANGSGKSTLMKITAGLTEYDSGRIIRPKGTRSAYLPQFGIVHKGRSLYEEAHAAFDSLTALENEAKRIEADLEKTPDNQEALMRYQEIFDTLHFAEWDRREARIEQVLSGLGFRRQEFTADSGSFSGGWQMRIALARILLEAPDILLLDEPTNYLDIEAREWLRNFIGRYPGGVMLVSHDRAFLDASCKQVANLWMTKLNIFKGTYSEHEKEQQMQSEALLERWKRQQEEIARIEVFINRFRYKDTKAAQVQSRVKMLEKMERIEIPPSMKRIKLHFPPALHSGKSVFRAEQLERRYGNKVVFSNLDLELPRGSRTAVTGVNGAGKTTLLRIASGNDSGFSGKIHFGSGVRIGYFSQDMEAALDASNTVLEEISQSSGEGEGKLRSLLGCFLFTGDDIYKKVEVLSGGERSRLALLKILLSPFNFLVLDEPTNHLDIASKDVLLDALQDYGGTLLIVSHDRYFLEHIADRVLEIKNGVGQLYMGSYAEYRQDLEKDQAEKAAQNSRSTKQIPQANHKALPKTLSREQQKEHKAGVARLKREEERLAVRLEEKEYRAAKVREELEQPENYSDPDKAHTLAVQLEDLKEAIERISLAWEEAVTALEKARNE